ncbi:hypothetical protein [Cellulomonas sp. PhB143]|uniref:hypothetical protein n=1 Tax=Cellulomonas sp. PhB143 TaxID=2485186 RepID=UPI000F48242F|nr:hypothetical protein [Cellulomonas sp. PhB143]
MDGHAARGASTSVARLNLPPAPSVPEPLRGRAVLAVRFAHAGDPAEADVLLAALRAAPARPIVDTVADLPYARLGAIHSDPQDPLPTVERGGALDELTDETIDAFCGAVSPQTPVVTAEIRLLGGAVARPAAVPSAVAGRAAEFSVLVVGLVGPGMPPGGPLAVRSVLGALAPWSSGGAMLNFAGPRDETSASLVRTAHGEPQYQRLVALRRANDPQGVLSASARWEVAADAV